MNRFPWRVKWACPAEENDAAPYGYARFSTEAAREEYLAGVRATFGDIVVTMWEERS